jgi:hypothetical protein
MTQPVQPASGAQTATMLPAQRQPAPAPVKPAIPKQLTCPVCQTSFGPRATAGKCPVCGEQVLPEADVARTVPYLTPAWIWLKAGGWRLVLVVAFVLYQIVLFIVALNQMKAAGVL